MPNLIVGAILVLIIGASISKVVIEKRRGNKCIGCPHGGNTKKTKNVQIDTNGNDDDCDCGCNQ